MRSLAGDQSLCYFQSIFTVTVMHTGVGSVLMITGSNFQFRIASTIASLNLGNAGVN